MKMRKITSLTAGLSFVLVLLTSIVLYIVPQGRVAYWADWRLWGLTKTEWGNIHINLGLLFLMALGLHIYYNWKPLVSYLRDKAKKMKLFSPEFTAALVITVLSVVGTYFMVPPFKWVMTLNDHFKDAGAEKYGEPPYGHAELSSLKTFAQKMNLDVARSMELLEKAGFPVDNADMTLAAIGRKYGVPPQKIYQSIQPATGGNLPKAEVQKALPDSPPPGTGNLTLADLSAQYGLDLQKLVSELKNQGLAAAADRSLKQIAEESRSSPLDVYETIQEIMKK